MTDIFNWQGVAKPKGSTMKEIKAETKVGTYRIEWDSSEYYINYDLFIDDEFITSDTSMLSIKKEAQLDYESQMNIQTQ